MTKVPSLDAAAATLAESIEVCMMPMKARKTFPLHKINRVNRDAEGVPKLETSDRGSQTRDRY